MKKVIAVLLSLIMAAGLTACGGGASSPAASGSGSEGGAASGGEPKVLTTSYIGDISTLDPNLCYNSTSAEVIGNTIASLFKNDGHGQLKNEICKDYTVSEDGKTYTFNLRDDFKWSNGEAVTAHDFVYSWRRLGDPNTGSTYAKYLKNANIVNADAIIKGEMAPDQLGVKAVDDYTLEVQVDRPAAYFLTFLCNAPFSPINQKYCESVGDKFGTTHDNAIYSGAYRVADWQTEYEIRMEKNPDYPMAAEVKIDTVVVKVVKDANTGVNLVETGEVDIVELTGEQAVQYKDDPRAVTISTTDMNFLVMNEQNPILANVNARKAISCVLDKQFIAEEIYANGSTVADYIIPYGLEFDAAGNDFRSTTSIPPATDIEKGKQYWEQAKSELNLPEYSIRLMIGDSVRSKKLSEFFQSQLEKNLDGLKVTFDYATSKNAIEKEISGDFDTTFSTWNVDYLDVAFFIDMFTTDFYANTGHFSNAEYDELDRLANEDYVMDQAKRWDAIRQAEQILVVDQMGTVPIFQSGRMYLVSDRVVGYYVSNISPMRFYANMDVK